MRTKIFWVTLSLVSIICAAFFCIRFFLPQEEYNELPLSRKNYTSDSLTREQVKEEKIKYYLTLEGEKLCAYTEDNGTKRLLHSKSLEPMLMSDEDLIKLKEGIYAESYEDLCLYFESYMS